MRRELGISKKLGKISILWKEYNCKNSKQTNYKIMQGSMIWMVNFCLILSRCKKLVFEKIRVYQRAPDDNVATISNLNR